MYVDVHVIQFAIQIHANAPKMEFLVRYLDLFLSQNRHDHLSFSFEPDLNDFYRLIEKDFHVAVLLDDAVIQLVAEVSILLESDTISSKQCIGCAVKNKVSTHLYLVLN